MWGTLRWTLGGVHSKKLGLLLSEDRTFRRAIWHIPTPLLPPKTTACVVQRDQGAGSIFETHRKLKQPKRLTG